MNGTHASWSKLSVFHKQFNEAAEKDWFFSYKVQFHKALKYQFASYTAQKKLHNKIIYLLIVIFLWPTFPKIYEATFYLNCCISLLLLLLQLCTQTFLLRPVLNDNFLHVSALRCKKAFYNLPVLVNTLSKIILKGINIRRQ